MGPYRAAMNWYLMVLVLGSICATLIVTAPLILVYGFYYGFPPPSPGWIVLRIIQVVQSVVVGFAGGLLTQLFFKKCYNVDANAMVKAMIRLIFVIPLLCVLIVLFISIPRYGFDLYMLYTAMAIFGPLLLIFAICCFYFAIGLNAGSN